MAEDRHPTSDELALWHRATRDVVQLRPEAGPIVARPVSRGTAPQKSHQRKALRAAAPASRSPAPGPGGLDPNLRRQLVRGRVTIDARLDLHGARQIQAHARLNAFIEQSCRRGRRCVLVITGKGSGTASWGEERGVLKRLVPEWLRQEPLRTHVIGFEPAHARHGGDGALYVLLRTKPARV